VLCCDGMGWDGMEEYFLFERRVELVLYGMARLAVSLADRQTDRQYSRYSVGSFV
jgi:hypothetical protein